MLRWPLATRVGFLFQLGKTVVAKKGLEGLWQNQPTQANDLSEVRWVE